jgi:hypothetical protein
MPLYPNLAMKSNKSQDRQLFFGINRYIKRANQKVAKNKNHERKALKKITKTKSKYKRKEKESQQIHNRKRTSKLKKLIRHA